MTKINTLEFSHDGSPWCDSPVGGVKVNNLDLSIDGSPWWANPQGSIENIITGNVKRILKVDWPYVKTIINVEG
jgi:hypothetical protein